MREFAPEVISWPALLCIVCLLEELRWSNHSSIRQNSSVFVCMIRDIQLVTQASREKHACRQSRFTDVNGFGCSMVACSRGGGRGAHAFLLFTGE